MNKQKFVESKLTRDEIGIVEEPIQWTKSQWI